MRNFFNNDNPVFQFLGRLADLMLLNLVFIICCIPIFTIGASLTALNYVTLKIAEQEDGYIVKGFFKSFRRNFRQATVIWLIILAVGVVIGVDFYILGQGLGSFTKVFRVILMATTFVSLMIYMYVFPVLARFDNTIKATLKNAFIMAIVDLPRTVIMLVITVGSVLVTLINTYTIAYGLLVWVICGFALVAYVNSLFMKKVIAKYMPKEEIQEEQDPDNWNVDETMAAMDSENESSDSTAEEK